MTPVRAQEVIRHAQLLTVFGSDSAKLAAVMTDRETTEVCHLYDELPPDACLLDALVRIAHDSSSQYQKAY